MTGAGRPIRILLVDDQELVRAGLRGIQRPELGFDVVGELPDGGDVVPAEQRHPPDVVLMDVRMPGLDGIAATRALVRAGSAARVLVLTTFANDDHVVDALAAGADGFLLKRSTPEEVLHGIRTVARGESLLFPDAVRHLVRRSRVPPTSPSWSSGSGPPGPRSTSAATVISPRCRPPRG